MWASGRGLQRPGPSPQLISRPEIGESEKTGCSLEVLLHHLLLKLAQCLKLRSGAESSLPSHTKSPRPPAPPPRRPEAGPGATEWVTSAVSLHLLYGLSRVPPHSRSPSPSCPPSLTPPLLTRPCWRRWPQEAADTLSQCAKDGAWGGGVVGGGLGAGDVEGTVNPGLAPLQKPDFRLQQRLFSSITHGSEV